jgi:hypothetical protein
MMFCGFKSRWINVLGVRRVESAANLQHDSRCFIGRKVASFLKESAEILPLDVVHSDEFDSVGFAEVEDSNYVRVTDLARENEFLLEASQHFWIAREFGPDQFEGDETIQFFVARLVDGTHTAAAKQLEDFIASRQQSARR